jgi:AraC family ethanolamine operon transcriptional activator
MLSFKLTSFDSKKIEDIDAMAGAIVEGLSTEYVQLEARPFKGHWTVLRLPDLVVQIGREDIAIVRRLRVPADRWAIAVPIAVTGSARWNACVMRPEDVLICSPGAECYAFDPGGTRFAVISLKVESCEAHRLPALARDSAPSAIATLAESDACALRAELFALDRASRLPQTSIAAVLQACLAHAMPRTRQIESFVGRSQIVRRAEDFFRHHVGEPVSIAQLSLIAGVSERSLRNAFYDIYTTSPKRYLKLWQLHQVRRALRSASGEGDTVTDVATLHGFYELGRFAGEYKALFGEAPSRTLNEARRRNAPRAACGVA